MRRERNCGKNMLKTGALMNNRYYPQAILLLDSGILNMNENFTRHWRKFIIHFFHVKQHVECMVDGDAGNEVSLCRNKWDIANFPQNIG